MAAADWALQGETEVVDNAKQTVIIVNHQHSVYLIFLKYALNLTDFRIGFNGLGVEGHRVAHLDLEEAFAQSLHSTTHIAIGDDANDVIILNNDAQTEAALTDMYDGLAQRHICRNDGEVIAAHDIAGTREQTATKGASGMEAGKVSFLELTAFDEGTSKRIAHSKRGSGAAGGSQAKRTSLATDAYIDVAGGVLGQEAFGIAGDANDGDALFVEEWHKTKEFVGHSRMTDGDDHIVARNDT